MIDETKIKRSASPLPKITHIQLEICIKRHGVIDH